MLSSDQLDGMRTIALRALPETCAIQRHTTVSDGGGGYTETWAEHADDVPCRIAPRGGGEGATAGERISDETTHVITLPADTDVTSADRVVVDDVVYEITAVRRRGAWEITRRVEVREAP